MSNKEIDQNITRLRKLVLGETNVNTLKEIIKCVDQVQFDFLKLKVEKSTFKRCFTDTLIMEEVSKEIQENKLIRAKKFKEVYNYWMDYQYNKGEENAK
jgi:hypothetical protein